MRQLENIIERSVARATRPVIGLDDLPLDLAMNETVPGRSEGEPGALTLKDARDRFEQAYVVRAPEREGWNQSRAARGLECETAANAEAVCVLVAGWTMPPEDAVTLMYTSLTAGLRRGRPLRGHEAPCEEVAEFARAFGRPPPACPGS